MGNKVIFYSNHAVKQMFQRMISTKEVDAVLRTGVTIVEYPEDKPFPSKILFAVCNDRPLHIVCSYNQEEDITVIITVYEPSLDIWEKDFKTRKKQ